MRKMLIFFLRFFVISFCRRKNRICILLITFSLLFCRQKSKPQLGWCRFFLNIKSLENRIPLKCSYSIFIYFSLLFHYICFNFIKLSYIRLYQTCNFNEIITICSCSKVNTKLCHLTLEIFGTLVLLLFFLSPFFFDLN